ncbi:hypothetical protein LTR78_010234 [Recurvomyces mirabilis]|uniref:Alpha-L-arabinofuranosidase n=1 Tax=Recurvomyces mirabilis TaxID=574656 RepID=A0AAE0TMI1_9PEZI|nr:hypothetical protein LTR78_010234 [Recurvomyces mirabilis]KAK5156421.1 hypothetical protein LTS14_005309 [Recurvomyces mirabilis]
MISPDVAIISLQLRKVVPELAQDPTAPITRLQRLEHPFISTARRHMVGRQLLLSAESKLTHLAGVYIASGDGYRIDKTNGVATGDAAEGIYAIFDGTHYNGGKNQWLGMAARLERCLANLQPLLSVGCCFDYGNAETGNGDTGAGHMEAVYFGNIRVWGSGAGNGPWIMADLENGLFSGYNPKQNTADPTITSRFVTAIVKGESNQWAIRGGNSASGSLSTYYSGVRPSGYNPMHKEGAIILGIGGDNSHGAVGTFYEGVMTSGYPSDATENSVQANIVAAKYTT